MKKEIAGQPLWLWAVAAGGLVLAYLYFKSHSSSSSTPSSGTGQGGTGKDNSQSSFREWITQHDASSGTHHRPIPVQPVNPGGPVRH